MNARNRLWTHVALFVAALGMQAQALAQDNYPSRPVKGIACCAGVVEVLARAIAEDSAATLGQKIYVETRPGQGGNIAAEAVARSKPDGYTIYFGTNSSHGANQSLYKTIPFDFVKDFTPIAGISEGVVVLVARPESALKTVNDLVAAARSKPDEMAYGWASSSTRMAMELVKQLTGTKIRQIPYKTNPQATTDLMGGQFDVMFADMTTAVPLIKAGKLRALAVSGSKRAESLPDVPTVQEAGVPGYQLTWWIAAWAPADTPQPIIAKLQRAIHASLAEPGVKQVLATISSAPMPLTSQELMAFQIREHAKWRQMITSAGIEPQ